MKNLFLFILLASCICFSAQEKAIDTVYLFDNQLNKSVENFHIEKLKQSDILENSTSLSDLLRNQSSIYIKENGRGAVSSPSFRGTTAQQTAFIWNGLNINSIFLGQGDINNINFLDADNISVKSGGGSLSYGSSAIGGSIHLNNNLFYNKGFGVLLFSEYGSFKTSNNLLKLSFSNQKFSTKINFTHNESENRYEVPEEKYINRNGQYSNYSFSLGTAYKFNEHQELVWQSYLANNDQHFPIFSENGNATKYKTSSLRNLLLWKVKQESFKNDFNLGYVEEEFNYFEDLDLPKSSGGTGKTFLIKDDFSKKLNQDFDFNILSEYQFLKGEGYGSGIENPSRNSFSMAGFLNYKLNNYVNFSGGIRKDFIQEIDTPLLYSASVQGKPADFYTINFNYSKNFRAPTFNDLYWKEGGNLNLKSEISNQFELRNNLNFENIKLEITPYYNHIDNMIQWLPTENGYFSPINTKTVEIKGLETSAEIDQNFGNHEFKFKTSYAYTQSKNVETDMQLSYIPLQKVTAALDYKYKNISFFAQSFFNGKTFSTTDESEKYALKSYAVLNLGLGYEFHSKYKIGFKVNNITDCIYETVKYFPLPKRNYSINILIKL